MPAGSRTSAGITAPAALYANRPAGHVDDPVVEAVGPSLPELDAFRMYPEPSPVRRSGNRSVAVLGCPPLHQGLQLGAIPQHAALWRRRGGDLRPPRPAGEVLVRLLGVQTLHRPLDPHLPVQLQPDDAQRGPPVDVDLPSLAALQVGVEGEPGRAVSLEQHHPGRRNAVAVRRGQRHGVRLGQTGLDGIGHPLLELADRIRIGIRHGQPPGPVILTQPGQPSIENHVGLRPFRRRRRETVHLDRGRLTVKAIRVNARHVSR